LCATERGKERATSSTLTAAQDLREGKRSGGAPDSGRQLHHCGGSGELLPMLRVSFFPCHVMPPSARVVALLVYSFGTDVLPSAL
jgi:hypothetical protein